jgi:hypothetical protein
VAPYEVHRSNPTLNREIVHEFRCFTKHGHRLSAMSHGFANNENSVELFARILKDPKRSHPVVYITPSAKGELLADVSKVARTLAGMAHVVVAEDPQLADKVSRALSADLECPPGGIRVYWPDFHVNQDSRHHPAFLDWQLLKMGDQCSLRLVDLISRQAVLRDPVGYADWVALQTWNYRLSVQDNQSSQQVLEMLAMFEEENQKQQQALASANKEIARLTEIFNKTRLQVEKLGVLLLDSETSYADAIIELPIGYSDEPSQHEDEEFDGADENISDEKENRPEQEIAPDELGVYNATYASYCARELYSERIASLNKGVATALVPESTEERPVGYKLSNGIIFYNLDWFEHSNGYGKILKLYAKDFYGPQSDKHRVWIFDQHTKKSSIMADFMLGQSNLVRHVESSIPEEVRTLFAQFDASEME